MGRMVRKQAYITEEQDALLKRRAAQLDVTESELIRRAIEQTAHRATGTPGEHAALRDEFAFMEERARASIPRDAQAWAQLLTIMEERGRIAPPTGEKRHWSREEMYDERYNPLPR